MNMNTENIHTSIDSTINTSMISDTISEPSSPESTDCDESDLLRAGVSDGVTTQLAAAGPVGVAAAAAIASGRKRKRPHSFETNPSIRKRQQTRLLRKLKATIDEYTTRVGQQAVVLCCTPGKSSQSSQAYKVFGSQPLENVIRNCRGVVMQDLETTLAQQAPPQQQDNPSLHELPPLVIDGIPTPVDKMTQAQLRAFIPEMLKYSTGRSKPGWGKPECRPVWWPNDVPWANVRSDVRMEEEKKKVSWTHALKTIVRNCYKHHGREDLMPDFEDAHTTTAAATPHFQQGTMVQTINNPDGTVSIVQIDTGEVHNPQVVMLADGTQAQVVHTYDPSQLVKIENGGIQAQQEGTPVQTLAEVATIQQEVAQTIVQQPQHVQVEVNSEGQHGATGVATLTGATINQDGQIVLTNDGSLAGGTISGLMTIPVSMYQTVVSNVAQLTEASQAHGVQVAVAPLNTEQQQLAQLQLQQQQSESQQQAQSQQQVGAQQGAGDAPDAAHTTTSHDTGSANLIISA